MLVLIFCAIAVLLLMLRLLFFIQIERVKKELKAVVFSKHKYLKKEKIRYEKNLLLGKPGKIQESPYRTFARVIDAEPLLYLSCVGAGGLYGILSGEFEVLLLPFSIKWAMIFIGSLALILELLTYLTKAEHTVYQLENEIANAFISQIKIEPLKREPACTDVSYSDQEKRLVECLMMGLYEER